MGRVISSGFCNHSKKIFSFFSMKNILQVAPLKQIKLKEEPPFLVTLKKCLDKEPISCWLILEAGSQIVVGVTQAEDVLQHLANYVMHRLGITDETMHLRLKY